MIDYLTRNKVNAAVPAGMLLAVIIAVFAVLSVI